MMGWGGVLVGVISGRVMVGGGVVGAVLVAQDRREIEDEHCASLPLDPFSHLVTPNASVNGCGGKTHVHRLITDVAKFLNHHQTIKYQSHSITDTARRYITQYEVVRSGRLLFRLRRGHKSAVNLTANRPSNMICDDRRAIQLVVE